MSEPLATLDPRAVQPRSATINTSPSLGAGRPPLLAIAANIRAASRRSPGLSTVAAGHAAYWLLSQATGHPTHSPGPAGPLLLCAFTVTMLLAYDISYYIYHRLQHRVQFMWELHKVHHSAEVMVGVTKDRVHWLDDIMNAWWDGLIPGLAYGVWLFFALDPVELTVFGINVYFLRNTLLMMDFIRHTHLKLSYGRWLNCILLCPTIINCTTALPGNTGTRTLG